MRQLEDGTFVVQCDKCLQWVDNSLVDAPYADNGCQLRIHGGYSEFIDPIHEANEPLVLLCHDCTLEFFRSIPKLAPIAYQGQHSVSHTSPNYPLCCEYSWSTDEDGETIFGTPEDFKPQRTYDVKD